MRPDAPGFPHWRYRLTGELGRGAGTTVHRALDLATGAEVALKSAGAEGRPGLRAEYARLHRLRHPGLVRALDLSLAGDTALLSLELLDEEFPSPASGKADQERTTAAWARLAGALGHLHQNGLVHGDIKPENLRGFGRGVKLIDLGLAGVPSSVERGRFAGTPAYAPPESLKHGQRSPAGDVYSLGLVIWELLGGELPGPESKADPEERWLEGMPTGLRPEAAEVLRGMLRQRVHERIGDGVELIWSMSQSGLVPEGVPDVRLPLAGRSAELRKALAACRSPGIGLVVRARPGTGRSRFLEELKFLLQLSGREAMLTGESGPPEPSAIPRSCVLLTDGPAGHSLLSVRSSVSLAEWGEGPADACELLLGDLSQGDYRAVLSLMLRRADADDLDRLAAWLWRQAGGHVKTGAGLVAWLLGRRLVRHDNLRWSTDWQGILALDAGRASAGAWGPKWESLGQEGKAQLKKLALSGPVSIQPVDKCLEEWTRPVNGGRIFAGEAARHFVLERCAAAECREAMAGKRPEEPSPARLAVCRRSGDTAAWLECCRALLRRSSEEGDREQALHYSALLEGSGLLNGEGLKNVFVQAAGLCRKLAQYSLGLELIERHSAAVAGDWEMSKAAMALHIGAGKPGAAMELARAWAGRSAGPGVSPGESTKESIEAGLLLGTAQAAAGDLERAGETIAGAAAKARALGDRGLLAQMHERLASLAQRSGDWESAARHAREGLELAGPDADAEAKEFLVLTLGNGLAQTGKPAEAVELLEKFLAECGGRASYPELGGMRACLGLCHLRLENWGRAVENLARAENLLRRTGDLRHRAFITSSLAMAHGAAGRHRLEMEKMAEAYHLSSKAGDMPAAAHCLGNAGFKQAVLGDRAGAARTIGQAMELAEMEPGGQSKPVLYKHLALVEYEAGRPERALELAGLSFEAAKATGRPPHFEAALFGALSALGLGDGDKAGECLKLAETVAAGPRQATWTEFAKELIMAGGSNGDGSGALEAIVRMREQGRPRDAALMSLAAAEALDRTGASDPWALLPHLAAAEAEFTRLGDRESAERAGEAMVKAARALAAMPEAAAGQGMLEAFYRLASLLGAGAGPERVGREAVEQAVRLSRAERGGLFMLDEAGRPALLCGVGLDPDTVSDAAEISMQAIGQAAGSGREVFSNDAQAEEEFSSRQSVRRNAIRSIACMPLQFREGAAGALYLDSRLSTGMFSAGRRRFLRALASLAGAVVEASRAMESLRQSGGEPPALERMVGSSPPVQEMKLRIRRAAGTGVNVLIEGETGTGKELAARAVHELSGRRSGPFVALDCGSLPETLLEAELFGHIKGAFTGAHADKQGLFETADGGTMFLDEITSASPAVQARLLRVIEEGEIRRVGDTRARKVDVRLICAANKDMEFEVGEGRFKQDLFYRLNEFRIAVPPLRERGGDVTALAESFRRRHQKKHGRRGLAFTPGARRAIARHPWPGNIRELDNAVQKAVIMAAGKAITEADLELPSADSGTAPKTAKVGPSRTILVEILRDCGNDTAKAAAKLGLSRRQIQRLMRKHRVAT